MTRLNKLTALLTMMGLLVVAGLASAAPPQTPIPPQAPPVQEQLNDHEKRIKALEAKVTPMFGQVYGGPPVTHQDWYNVPGIGMRSITIVQPYHHAHYTIEGKPFVHHNNQNGVPGAHIGLNPTRIAEAGQTIPLSTQTYTAPVVVQTVAPVRFLNSFRQSSDGCSDGNCGRRGLLSR